MMDVGKGMFKRNAFAVGVLAMAVALPACSSSTDDSPKTEKSQEAPHDVHSAIKDPRDASATDLCGLLPADAATSLGLNPEGEKQSNLLDEDAPEACEWRSADGFNVVALTVLNDRSIETYRDNREQYVEFKEMQIAGHPAVRANQDDPVSGGTCDLFVASKEGQVVYSYSGLGPDEVGKVDSCELGRKALEAAVPTWPSAK